MTLQDEILEEIKAERFYQIKKWGNHSDDTQNTPWMWASYISHYATRWMTGSFVPLGRDTTNKFRSMMIKVAAIAIAAVSSIDRQRADKGKTFYE